jgi:protein-disulfide isomerase
MNKIWIWVALIVVVIGGLVLWSKGSGSKIEPAFEIGVVHPLDHVKGNASSTVVLMEYSDFQCPACRAYYPIMREVMTEFGDKVLFVYRHFPLTSIHFNSEFAARAAEAANKQGKFWEMHDLLFEKQNEWANIADPNAMFESYATLIGLNLDQFKTDFKSPAVRDLVRAERTHAIQSGLQGTPTFFLNGKQIQNPTSVDEFKSIIRAAIENSIKAQ